MNSVVRTLGLLGLAVGLVLPVSAAAKKGAPKAGKEKSADADYVIVGSYLGQITDVDPAQRSFVVQVTVRQPDPDSLQRLQQLQVQLAQHQAQFNQGAVQNDLNQIRQVNQAMDKKIDRPLEAAGNVRVRTAQPPVQFSANGKRKKYSSAELTRLKGGSHWGYPSDFEQVAVGQTVKVLMGVKRSVYEAAARKKKSSRTRTRRVKKGMEDPEEYGEDAVVRQIQILASSPMPQN